MKAAVLALVLAAAHPSVASSSDNCKPVSAPAAAHYATTLIQQTHRSGVNDYEAWWAPVKKAQGYHLCWDIAGQDKFTGNYVKSVNCVRLREGAGHTLFNNGERTYAAPRISNTFQNVRVASVSACGAISNYTAAAINATPAVPYVCPAAAQSEEPPSASVNLTAQFGASVVSGKVTWSYANKTSSEAKAKHMVCVVQSKGELGITKRRTCQVIGKNKSSAKFSIPLYAETLLLEAEVRPLPSCVAAYDTSSALIAPPKLLPWGTAIVNTLPVCLTSVNGSIVYSACSAKNVIVVKADVTPEGYMTGVYSTATGQCVLVSGSSVALGPCPASNAGIGWMTWRENDVSELQNQYVRAFPDNLCMPFGSANAVMGQKPTLVSCSTLVR